MTSEAEVNVSMAKSIHQKDYGLFLVHLRTVRRAAGLTQDQVAERLGQTQSFVSKCELGERRIDIIELRSFCQALGLTLVDFVRDLEAAITAVDAVTLQRETNISKEALQ